MDFFYYVGFEFFYMQFKNYLVIFVKSLVLKLLRCYKLKRYRKIFSVFNIYVFYNLKVIENLGKRIRQIQV